MQHLDFLYSKYCILYEIIAHALRPSTNPTKPPPKPRVDGVVGSYAMVSSIMVQFNQMSFQLNPSSQAYSSQEAITPPYEVLMVQATNQKDKKQPKERQKIRTGKEILIMKLLLLLS